ncbi:hypothetical protein CCUS01_11622 [Colletotrichum cuscutae]|uniref:Uncharacterized protein n=1 Tax=Colletotrichum cuscutae TaxID=1209917 RepID=A0AAI9XHH1_9PEZI|nr:hypothetical protein CCUS01_11622 [Colletotrichum cuscutae]
MAPRSIMTAYPHPHHRRYASPPISPSTYNPDANDILAELGLRADDSASSAGDSRTGFSTVDSGVSVNGGGSEDAIKHKKSGEEILQTRIDAGEAQLEGRSRRQRNVPHAPRQVQRQTTVDRPRGQRESHGGDWGLACVGRVRGWVCGVEMAVLNPIFDVVVLQTREGGFMGS